VCLFGGVAQLPFGSLFILRMPLPRAAERAPPHAFGDERSAGFALYEFLEFELRLLVSTSNSSRPPSRASNQSGNQDDGDNRRG
jgi:hypothetical protein